MAAKRRTRRSGARAGVGARVLEAAGEVGRRKGAVAAGGCRWMRERRARIVT